MSSSGARFSRRRRSCRIALLAMLLQASALLAAPPVREGVIDGSRPILALQVQASFLPTAGESIAPDPRRAPPIAALNLGGCDASILDLCFAHGERQAFYRAARGYMPAFDGLTAEGLSLRRRSLTFRYSFR